LVTWYFSRFIDHSLWFIRCQHRSTRLGFTAPKRLSQKTRAPRSEF
jgi:hypothetical protein